MLALALELERDVPRRGRHKGSCLGLQKIVSEWHQTAWRPQKHLGRSMERERFRRTRLVETPPSRLKQGGEGYRGQDESGAGRDWARRRPDEAGTGTNAEAMMTCSRHEQQM